LAVTNVIPETLAQALKVDATAWAALNGKWIKDLLDKHTAWLEEAKVDVYQKAYDGYLESIDLRNKARGDDTNNKLQVNYAQIVIDTAVDYLTGKPIVWTVEDPKKKAPKELIKAYRDDILELLRTEEAQRVLSEMLRQGSLAGYSAVISWVDEKGNLDYDEFPAQEVIPIYDDRKRLRMVLRTYQVDVPKADGSIDSRTRVEVYDEKYLTYYLSDESGENYELDESEVATGNPVEHKAGRIPVAIFVNGTPATYEKRLKLNGTSDLGNGILSVLENYAAAMSDKANTVDYLLDQFLLLTGVDTDEGEVIKMRKARAIALKNKESKAEFISQSQDDESVEHHLDRLNDTIHDMGQIPKLADLTGATATEIKVKYSALDIKAGKKELYLGSAIRQLIGVLTDLLNAKRLTEAGVGDTYSVLTGEVSPPTSVPLYDAKWVAYTINRNMPQNFLEIAQIVAALAGKVPDSYLYELLWFVDDPVEALEEMKKQNEETAAANAKAATAALGFGGEFGSTGSSSAARE